MKKLKYGGDLVFRALSWLGIGARADVVQPSSKDPSEAFWVVSPKIIFRTAFITHEEITAQYSHYGVQERRDAAGARTTASRPTRTSFGIKATMWW